jgi:leader peptidase (prepilin peptidase)/N-methyltransferase
MVFVLLFILGSVVGSFLNVCIYRLPRGESVTTPPSHCPRCQTRLATRDLLPLVSQVLLKARCRYCSEPISWRYFGIEFLTGLLFALAGWWAGPIGLNSWNYNIEGDWIKLLQGLIFMATLVVVFWVDYDTRMVPLEAVLLLGLAGVARDAWLSVRGFADANTGTTGGGLWPGSDWLPAAVPGSLWAMVVVAAGLWALRALFTWLYGKEALGFGDVLLVGAIAANLGWNPTLWTFAFASVTIGALIGVLVQIPRAVRSRRWAGARAQAHRGRGEHEAALQWSRRANGLARRAFRKAMPFGPMIAIGAVIALLCGHSINGAYLRWVQGDSGFTPPVSQPLFP